MAISTELNKPEVAGTVRFDTAHRVVFSKFVTKRFEPIPDVSGNAFLVSC